MTTPAEKLTHARLQVVQPGGKIGFRRRVLDAMRTLVPAPCAFFCFGRDDAHAYIDSIRLVGNDARSMAEPDGKTLTEAFGFDTRSVVETQRRVYLAEELYPAEVRKDLPYFAKNAVPDALTDALLVFLHEGGVLFGLAGLERREGDPKFDQEDVARLEDLTTFVMAGVRAQLAYEELSREASALRALGKIQGTLFVVDREAKKVLWAANRAEGIDWKTDVLPIEAQVVNAAEAALAAKTRGDALPTPPRLPCGVVQAVTKLEGDPVFGAARCAVVRTEPVDDKATAAMEGLSKREREIARLLVAGYSGVNVAAIAGLSENTVRTYVRRLYAKLGVSNRADLVLKLVSPEPKSSTGPSSPGSALAPPPDSSLVYGDDTLD